MFPKKLKYLEPLKKRSDKKWNLANLFTSHRPEGQCKVDGCILEDVGVFCHEYSIEQFNLYLSFPFQEETTIKPTVFGNS